MLQIAKERNIVTGNERKANLNKFLEGNNPSVPKVVYHGTKRDFSEFKPKYDDNLSFFSTNPKFASKWAVGSGGLRENSPENQAHYEELRELEKQLGNEHGENIPRDYEDPNWIVEYDKAREKVKADMLKKAGFQSATEYENNAGNQVMPAHLSVKNPFHPPTHYKEIESVLNAMPTMGGIVDRGLHKQGNWVVYENPEVINYLKDKGYDAVWLAENTDGPHETIAPFSSTQIKSATGNQGTFDPNEPDITKADGGAIHMAGGGDAIGMAIKMAKKLPRNIVTGNERQANLNKFLENSKVKEKMYRGATPHFQLQGEPIFVSPTVRFAEKFPVGSASPRVAANQNQTIYPLHVNATNPFDYENTDDIQKVIYEISKSDPEQAEKLKNEFKYYANMGDKFGTQTGNWGLIENTLVQDAIKKLGYDSFYVNEEGIKNLGVYDPSQVKTAIGNQGTFDPNDVDMTKASGGEVHMAKGGAEAIKQAIKQAKSLPPPENARRTQIIGTLPTYEKAKMLFELNKAKGRGIDYGAGLGEGAKILKADTYEPYPQDWKPTFTNPEDIPDEAYGKLTNLNVLNVVPREIRDEMVLDMGRVMRPKSHGIITTRGADVMKTQGEKGPEPMSMITSRETYQKGFEKNELIDYLRYMLGDDFDIDKLNLGKAGAMIQKKAGGGEVHMSKGGAEAIKQAVKQAKKAPMIMKKVSASEPELQARIREMKAKGQIYESDKPVTPEFIRPDPEKSTNPAGYSRKQWEKNQQYQSTIRPTHQFSQPEMISPEDIEGSPLVIIPGDRTIGGAEIVDVNGLPLTKPAQMYAGPSYGHEMADKGIDEFWASQLGAASAVQNKAKHAYEETGEIPLGIYSAMGPETGNYSMHNTDVALNLINARNPSRAQLKAFEDLMKQGFYDPTKKKQVTFDKFSFDDMDELKSNLATNPDMRKFFINRLEKPTISEALDMPSGLEIRHAITEPRLRDVPAGTTGFSLGRLKPESDVYPNKYHPTYDTSIPGEYMGRMELQLPYEEYFPTNYANIMSNPKQASAPFGTLQGLKTYETVTPELVDRLMKMKELIKTGRYKAGGAVGMKDGGKGTVSIEGVTYQPDPIYTDPMGATVPLSINENESIYQPILKDDQMRLELANKPKPIATPISFDKEPYRDPLTGILVDDPLSALPPGANVKPSTKYPQITPFPTSLEPPKNTMTAAGVLEPLATLGSGMLSFFPALPYAFGKSVLTNSDFPTNFNEAMSVGTRIPRSEEGLANLESIGDMLDKVSKEYKLAPIMPELHGFEPILTANALRGARAGARGATDLTKALGEKAYLSTENMLRNQGLMPSIVPQGQTTTAPISPKDDFGFYSKLERSALNLQRKQGNGQAFINELKSKGATPEELDMSGLKEFLATKPNFTKQEVQDYVQSHRPKLNEKVLVDRPALDSMINEKLKTFGYTVEDTIEGATGEPSYIFYDKNGNDVDYEDLPSDVQNFISENFSSNTIPSAKYADMKGTRTPGGENYREVLITYPKRAERGTDGDRKNEIAKIIFGADNYDSLNYRQKESVLSRLRLESQVYDKGHFGEVADNVMAHLRLDDRTDVDGKKGTLVDELQSDIHQEGRESGYKKDYEENDEINQLLKKRGNEGLVANEVKQLDKLITNATLVPDAPYKDDWYKIGLKKAIQKSVENGDDRIYTPTGKDLIDRYESELRKNVDYINYEPFEEDGVKYYEISAGKNGEEVFSKEGVTEEELQKLLGKSIAKKIINNQGESAGTEYRPDWKMLVGDDLSIGGSGMIEYYDKRYPAYLKDFAKKYGGTVGETKIFLNKKYYLADMEGNLLDSAGWTKEKDAIEAGEWRNRGNDNQDWQVIQKKEVTEDDMKRMYGYSDEEWARVSPEQRRGMANTLNKDSLRKVYYYEPSEEAKKKIIGGLPYKEGGAVHMQDGGLPIRAHNREFETPDLMNARDIGVTGDYEGKSLTLGKQQMRKDFDDATKMKREMDYIRYSQPFREGRVSAMAMKDPSNPIYQGMLQYDQPMMGGNAGIGVMGMRTPEEDYKLKALQLMYQKQLGKDMSLTGFAGMPFGGKPSGGVQLRGRFAEGGIVDDYIQGFPMGSRFVQKKAPQPVAVQAKPTLDNFEHALGFVLPHEGGYNNRKGDSPTNYGIKQSVYSDYLGRPATIDDIKNMPMEHAKEIYRKQYWNPIEAHGLDLKPSVVAFDAAVNQGPTFARSMVGSTQGDIEKMLEARQQRYNEVIKNNPSKRRFKAGWDNRMNAVRNYAMEDYHAKGGKVSMDDMNIALLRNK
jgi:hypothetical protein